MKNCFCKICKYRDLSYMGCADCESGNIENAPINFELHEVARKIVTQKVQECIRDYINSTDNDSEVR